MIDFKKELLKFKPVRTVDDVQDGIITGEIDDIGELLQYISGKGLDKAVNARRSGLNNKE